MKYLEDMSDEELLMIAKRERILLSLKFLRGELINSLETKGYAKKDPVKVEAEKIELEKERNRPKKSEIRIAPDGSVEVVEIPLDDSEIEVIEEVQEKVPVRKEYLQEEKEENFEIAEEIVKEINKETAKTDEVNLVSNTVEKEELGEPVIEKAVEKAEIKVVEEVKEQIKEEVIITEEHKTDSVVEEVRNINQESASEDNNIRIVILNQEEKGQSRRIKRKYHRNYILRRSSKSLRRKTRDLYDLNTKVDSYPLSLDEDLIKRRMRERKIQNSKYIVGRGKVFDRDTSQERFFDKAPLPSSYFVDEIVLMPKNNNTLFTYWEVREDTYNKLREENNISSNIIIKVYKDGVEDQRIIRSERLGSHYIYNIEAAKNYDVSIGYEDENGEFLEIAHSSKALSPRDKVSETKEAKWLKVEDNYEKEEVEAGEDESSQENYIDEDVFSILLDKLRNVRSS